MKVTVHLKQRSWDGSGSAHSKIRESKRLLNCFWRFRLPLSGGRVDIQV